MDSTVIIGIGALLLALISGGVLLYYLAPREQANMRSLMSTSTAGMNVAGQSGRRDLTTEEMDRLKVETKKRLRKKKSITLEERFFRAGIFLDKEKRDFHTLRVSAPIVVGAVAGIGTTLFGGASLGLLGGILGVLLGCQLPFSILDRRAKQRAEDIMFYLPLVIEQIAIGVSSSLDIGPCLQRVVAMADERDTHNVVTELVKYTQNYIKSGVSLEDAFTEVGKLSGHTELKHSFMSLAQVAKHGGEITRQLQELADAVAAQRETGIEAKIKKLELVATGPVALVFCGFLIILMIGFGLRIVGAFQT